MTDLDPGSKDIPTVHFLKLTLYVQCAPALAISDAVTLILKRQNGLATAATVVIVGFEAEEVWQKDLTTNLSVSNLRKKRGKKS